MCLFELWFPQDICPVMGLLGQMVVLFLVFKKLFIFIFGCTHCYLRAFSSCGERRLLSHCYDLSLWGMGSVVVAHRLSCPEACGIFLDQELNPIPCIGRWILNHWTTREVQWSGLCFQCRGHGFDPRLES